MEVKQKSSAMALTGLILGIVGLLLSAVPIINNFAAILAVLGLIFAIVGLVKTKGGEMRGKGIAISAVIVSIIALIVVVLSQQMYSAALNQASNEVKESVEDSTGENTEAVLQNDVDVKLGKFATSKDEYGVTTTQLPVTLTNKNNEKKSYTVLVEAVDAEGKRIAQDTLYANDLGGSQTQDLKMFEFVESDKVSALETAEFKIVSVSKM